ncbi:MAG: four helix bundle protein, partial [Clostridia bacterium]|nr:four helix bundle protein [Clostridia bacterium]
MTNKITLKPQGFNNTIAESNNITPARSEYNLKDYYFLCIIILEVITLADSVLRDKAKDFAKTVVFLCRDMKLNHKESVLINQLLRSATSIGAN